VIVFIIGKIIRTIQFIQYLSIVFKKMLMIPLLLLRRINSNKIIGDLTSARYIELYK